MDPLDIDGAMALMETAPANPGVSDWTPDAERSSPDLPVEATPEPAEPEENTPPADETVDTGETNTPPAEGETNDGTADQGALPIIEPPSSWKKEEQDAFRASPRAAQEAYARREQERTSELRTLQNSTAAEKQAVVAEAARLKGLTSQIDAVVNTQVADLTKEFPEIKSEADVVSLATNDPARYAVFQAKLMALNATQQVKTQAVQEAQARESQAHAEMMAQAKTALLEAFPTWKDVEVAQKEITAIQDYAISLGVPEKAARSTIDPFVYKLANKAMLYDRAQAAKTAAVDRTPPRTPVKPGSGGTGGKGERQAGDRQAQLNRLARTGDIDDALGLLRG